MGIFEFGDMVLVMDLLYGGYFMYGVLVFYMGKIYNFVCYKMKFDGSGDIDFDELCSLVFEYRLCMVFCGYLFYLRDYDYVVFKVIVDEIDVLIMVDVLYIGGFIVGDVFLNFCDFGFDFVIMMMYKSLCGLCGGMIFCCKEFKKVIDKVVFLGF